MLARVVYIEHRGTEHVVDVPVGNTLMEGAIWNRVPGMAAACGGAGGCATCQVIVEDVWLDRIIKPSSNERRTLRFAYEPGANSRLGCQIVMTEALDGLVLRLPKRQY